MRRQNNVLKPQSDALRLQNNVLKHQNDVMRLQNDVLKPQTDVLKLQTDVLKFQNDVLETQNDVMKSQNDVISPATTIPMQVITLEADDASPKSMAHLQSTRPYPHLPSGGRRWPNTLKKKHLSVKSSPYEYRKNLSVCVCVCVFYSENTFWSFAVWISCL